MRTFLSRLIILIATQMDNIVYPPFLSAGLLLQLLFRYNNNKILSYLKHLIFLNWMTQTLNERWDYNILETDSSII